MLHLFTCTAKNKIHFVADSSRSRGGNTRCRVPKAMSGHGKGGKRWPKAEKGLDKDDSLKIFKTTGVFVAVGSSKYLYSS